MKRAFCSIILVAVASVGLSAASPAAKADMLVLSDAQLAQVVGMGGICQVCANKCDNSGGDGCTNDQADCSSGWETCQGGGSTSSPTWAGYCEHSTGWLLCIDLSPMMVYCGDGIQCWCDSVFGPPHCGNAEYIGMSKSSHCY